MIAAMLELSQHDVKALRITDLYSIHKVVYDLFEDVRDENAKNTSRPSGILFVDKGRDHLARHILILANREPTQPTHSKLNIKPIPQTFLDHQFYRFEVTLNPTKRDAATSKTVAIKGQEELVPWFLGRCKKNWGFSVDNQALQINNMKVERFHKKNKQVTLNSATFKGVLEVTDRTLFIQSFQKGIGRARAFGFGLMQLVPLPISKEQS